MFIQQLTVKNYRSLRNVQIGNLQPIVVFYGDNDSGKSNILSFLEDVFRPKQEQVLPETATTEAPVSASVFWRGEIDDFSDNFYKNQSEPIEFTIVVRFSRQEIDVITGTPEVSAQLSGENDNANLTINGRIEAIGADRAKMVLVEARLNNKSFYSTDDAGPKYLSDFGLAPAQALDAFNKVMGSLDNGFVRVPANRFITTEKELPSSESAQLDAATFKNWLFQTSLNRDTEGNFRRISDEFAAEPFSHGRLSLARVGENLEVFVERKDGFKLPLGRKGTGVQQLLMILAYVAVSKAPIVGIEELEINLSPQSQTAIFNDLLRIIQAGGPIKQIFLTTHSPTIAKRNEAAVRAISMNANEETEVSLRTEGQVHDFFKFPFS